MRLFLFIWFSFSIACSTLFAQAPDCSKAKTPDECADCCGQLVGSNDSRPLMEGCAELAAAKTSDQINAAATKLEYETGISEASLRAICTKGKTQAQQLNPKEQNLENESRLNKGVTITCIQKCRGKKKADK